MSETELELIRRLKKGDPSAFHRLVDGYANRLYGLAHSLLGNAQDAEDVVQETLSGVFRSIGMFQERSSLWTWLAKILVRQVARSRRSLTAKSFRLRMDSPVEELDRSTGLLPGVASVATRTDAKIDVAAALDTLSPEYREIVVLREMQHMSYEEISQVLGMPLGTVESRLFRARGELRKLLAAWKA